MDEKPAAPAPGRGAGKWVWLVVGVAVFAVLMSFRSEFDSTPARMAMAACAFAVLALSVVQMRRR